MGKISELDDLALVRQIQHGDESAIEEFYYRFASGVYAFIHRKVQQPEDIEDILAETMAAAVTSIMRFQGQSQVFTWLCRIASFKLADHYRRSHSKQTLPLEEAMIPSLPEKDLETNLVIYQALHRLNREYRQVLEDKYFNGYTTREIAFRFGRSEKAIESVLNRARQAFAREYQRIMPEAEVEA
jgi:RNA polymerase sigma-70 factor (ECF subfamily)